MLARCGGGVHGGEVCGRSGKRKILHATVVAVLLQQQELGAGVGVHRHGCGVSGGCGNYVLGNHRNCRA